MARLNQRCKSKSTRCKEHRQCKTEKERKKNKEVESEARQRRPVAVACMMHHSKPKHNSEKPVPVCPEGKMMKSKKPVTNKRDA
jgi:hypothetical protein